MKEKSWDFKSRGPTANTITYRLGKETWKTCLPELRKYFLKLKNSLALTGKGIV